MSQLRGYDTERAGEVQISGVSARSVAAECKRSPEEIERGGGETEDDRRGQQETGNHCLFPYLCMPHSSNRESYEICCPMIVHAV